MYNFSCVTGGGLAPACHKGMIYRAGTVDKRSERKKKQKKNMFTYVHTKQTLYKTWNGVMLWSSNQSRFFTFQSLNSPRS